MMKKFVELVKKEIHAKRERAGELAGGLRFHFHLSHLAFEMATRSHCLFGNEFAIYIYI